MSAQFAWTVETPEGTAASGTCELLVVPTASGELGVLADHAALVACVVPGDLRIRGGGSETSVRVGAGVVDVRDNRVRLLVSSAAAPPA